MSRRYIDVIYEDHDLLVVNKPRGIIVARDKDEKHDAKPKPALVDDVQAYIVRKFSGAKASFARPMHRLDKETTGVVLFAKSNAALPLVDAIKRHLVKRKYIAIVEGQVPDSDGTIKLALEKGDFGHGKKVALATKEGSKPAITHYHVIERYENATMVEARLETGFTHQIRVHFAAIGFPLVGDKIYNPHGKIRFHRQALHAREVEFKHPVTGKKTVLNAALPKDMEGLIDTLRGC